MKISLVQIQKRTNPQEKTLSFTTPIWLVSRRDQDVARLMRISTAGLEDVQANDGN